MIRPFVLASLLAACARPSTPIEPEPAPAPAPRLVTIRRTPEPPALTPLREAVLALDPGPAPPSLQLHPVIEGTCAWLDVSFVDGEPFIHGPPGRLDRVLPDGTLEHIEVPASVSRRNSDTVTIDRVDGRWPGDLWVHFRDDITRIMQLSELNRPRAARRRAGVWSIPADPRHGRPIAADRVHPWPGGFLGESFGTRPRLTVLGEQEQWIGFDELSGEYVEHCVHRQPELRVFPGGNLVLVGAFCRAHPTVDAWDLVAARWSGERGVVDVLPHPRGLWMGDIRVAASSLAPIHVGATFRAGDRHNDYTTLTSFDGAAWSAPAVFAGRLDALSIDRDGAPWLVADGELHRRASDGTWEHLAPSAPLEVREIGDLDGEVAWLYAAGGDLWLRPEGGAFVRVPVETASARPRVKMVKTRGTDVWVHGEYHVGDRRFEILLRNGAAHDPHVCRGK
jgi:hypothetical protein